MAETRPLRRIKLTRLFPDGINPDNPDDMMRLTRAIQEKAAKDPDTYGGYLIDSISDDGQYAVIAPMAMPTDDKTLQKLVAQGEARAEEIDVADSIGEARQKQTVDRIELNYASSTDPAIIHEAGKTWKVIDFIPRTSVKCAVMLQLMDERTISVRQQFADALGIARYPWQIRITPTAEGGWKIRIRSTTLTYRPSAHDRKLQETVESVGAPGWFFKGDADNGVITVYPGMLPTFPKVINPPQQMWVSADLHHGYFAMRLPDRGRETGDLLANNWQDAPGVLVAGASNGGKSVVINNLVYSALSAGCDIAVCDDADKSADFIWCRDWVIDHGWGCDSKESIAATLQHVLDICAHRANLIKQYGKMNYYGLPEDVRRENPVLLLVCDEIAQWASPLTVPPGLSKDNPTRIKMEYEKGINATNYMLLRLISQKARFAGICFLYASQSATAPNGLDPSVRTNLSSRIIVGAKVSDSVRDNVLNDAKSAPKVGEYLISSGVSVGTGVCELGGKEACVYKSFYVDDKAHGLEFSDILRQHLMQRRPPQGNGQAGHWDWGSIVRTVPAAAEKPDDGSMYADDDEPVSRLEQEGGFGEDGRDVAERDAPLRGAARAAHMSAIEQAKLTAQLSAEKGM